MLNTHICILICPLNWGIGHASRMIPLIYALNKLNYRVLISGSGKSLELLRISFPDQQIIDAPHFSVKYSDKCSMSLKLTFQLPKVVLGIVKDYIWLKKIIPIYNINLVISDNRYGLFNRKVISVLVSHQIYPFMPKSLKWAEPLAKFILGKFIKAFDRCWVPDYANPAISLTGSLSHHNYALQNISFMGILSRFSITGEINEHFSEPYDIVVILSGPEPQRSIFEEIIVNQIKQTNYKSAIICGIHQPQFKNKAFRHIDFFYHLPAVQLKQLLYHAGVIICRAGYSTIMDLVELKLKAVLIPTPGQPEQEYLASFLEKKGFFYSMNQRDFNIEKAIQIYRSGEIKMKHLPKTNIKAYLNDIEKLLHNR
jgi:uncharacterized protein (TIGR00661 family)